MNDQIEHPGDDRRPRPGAADPVVPPIPVICDRCRAEGFAGDEVFSAIPDILDFTPVQRRAHVNGWTDQHQRAFIAALAITGSPRQAARAIGKHAFGAEQLRTHRNGKSFAAAWEAAMELARERETHRIHDNLAELVSSHSLSGGGGPPQAVEGKGIHPDCDYDPEIHTEDYPEYWEGMNNIRERLLKARRLLLFLIRNDEDKRGAWETLVGPTDWAKAERLEPQDDEPIRGEFMNRHGMPNMLGADMLLTAEAGLLPDLCGGHDLMADIKQQVEEIRGEADFKAP